MSADASMLVRRRDISRAATALGLSGPMCVHASLRSFGWVAGGAAAIVDGLLDAGCTVLVPAFTYGFFVSPPAGMRPPRNGYDYRRMRGSSPGRGRVFTPNTDEVESGLGVVPAEVISRPGRARGDHPLNSFAGVGPLAQGLLAGQAPLHVYAPLEALAEAGGAVVLMGVGLDRMTLLHLAEQRAGRTLFRRWANRAAGRPAMVETGSCSHGFPNLEPWLADLERHGMVGESIWRVFPARETLQVAVEAIRQDAWVTHCGNPTCLRCRDAVLGGPILTPAGSQGDQSR